MTNNANYNRPWRTVVTSLIVALCVVTLLGFYVVRQSQKLLTSEQNLVSILKATERAVVLVTVANKDGQGTIRQITGAAEVMFGWAIDELDGRPVEILMAPEAREKHRIGLANLIAWIESEIAAGRDVNVPVQAIRCDGFTKGEQRIPVLVVTSFAGVASSGEILMVAAIYDARNAKIVIDRPVE